MTIIYFILGLLALVAGAEVLVRGASKLALSIGVSPLVVGLTVVALGTSAPEVAVSVSGAIEGKTGLAVGNVVGSNIFNILLILGVSALIRPLVVHAQIIRQELPIMLGASGLFMVMALDGALSQIESGVLLALLVAYTVFLVRQSRAETKAIVDEYAEGLPAADSAAKKAWDHHWSVQVGLILAGLGLLVLGSNLLVDAAIVFAKALGVSDVIIGLTIVAAGTSLPEVATSVTAAIRGQRDIAVGNVIGSNTFNILGCLGASGLVAQGGALSVDPAIMNFDLWVMLAVSVATLPIFITGREIARWEGLVFLAYYVAYTVYLVLEAQGHDALPAFSNIMMAFVVPLTLVTLVASLLRAKHPAPSP